jgi:hypothetical protein
VAVRERGHRREALQQPRILDKSRGFRAEEIWVTPLLEEEVRKA